MLSDERVSSGDDWRGAYNSDGILIATVPRPTQRVSSKTRALRFTHWRMNSSCRVLQDSGKAQQREEYVCTAAEDGAGAAHVLRAVEKEITYRSIAGITEE